MNELYCKKSEFYDIKQQKSTFKNELPRRKQTEYQKDVFNISYFAPKVREYDSLDHE